MDSGRALQGGDQDKISLVLYAMRAWVWLACANYHGITTNVSVGEDDDRQVGDAWNGLASQLFLLFVS